MKKLILLLTLFSLLFSAEKWEYAVGIYTKIVTEQSSYEDFVAVMVGGKINNKYNISNNEKLSNKQLVGMNRMGADGWELMFKEKGDKHSNYIYFKRKVDR